MKIGDFAKLTKLPVKTIRYYSDLGLLTPKEINKFNNYREYDFVQLIEINRILALKEAGFTLAEIKKLLKNHISSSDFLSLLETKLEEAKQEQTLTNIRISNIQARIKNINLEEDYRTMLEVNIKRTEPIWVASIREQDRNIHEFSQNFEVLDNDLKTHGVKETGPILMIYHEEVHGLSGTNEGARDDWEACVQIEKEYISGNPKIKVHQLPAVEKAASIVYKGPHGTMGSVLDSFLEWCKLNDMEWGYPYREIFHVAGKEYPDAVCPSVRDVTEDDDNHNFITEMQFPLR